MKRLLATIIAPCFLMSCGTKTVLYQRGVYAPTGEPIKLAEFGSNVSGLTYKDGATELAATEIDNAESTRAQNELPNNVIDSAQAAYTIGQIAGAIKSGIDAWAGNKANEATNATTQILAKEETAQIVTETAADVATTEIIAEAAQ